MTLKKRGKKGQKSRGSKWERERLEETARWLPEKSCLVIVTRSSVAIEIKGSKIQNILTIRSFISSFTRIWGIPLGPSSVAVNFIYQLNTV